MPWFGGEPLGRAGDAGVGGAEAVGEGPPGWEGHWRAHLRAGGWTQVPGCEGGVQCSMRIGWSGRGDGWGRE